MTAAPRVLGSAIHRSYSCESPNIVNQFTDTRKMEAPALICMATAPFKSSRLSSSKNTCQATIEQTKKPLEKQFDIFLIFRSRPVFEEDDDDSSEFNFWALKHATPIIDPDEESPRKRWKRTTLALDEDKERSELYEGEEIPVVLSQNNRLFGGDDGSFLFSIVLSR